DYLNRIQNYIASINFDFITGKGSLDEIYGDSKPFLFKKSGQIFLLVTAVIIGVLGAYGAILFRYLYKLSHHLFFSTDSYETSILLQIPWLIRLIVPVIGGLLVGLIITRIAPEVKGSGVPEVMEAFATKGGIIRFRVFISKAITSAITIGSGGSAGREGPIVHIGAAIGSAIGQVLKVNTRQLRTFLACGAAAGLSATFNAPIAGAIFAIEIIIADMRVVNMPPIIISSVVATVVSRYYLGDYPAFIVPAYDMLDARELFIYAALGIIAGLASVVFIRLFLNIRKYFEEAKLPPWTKPAIGGLAVGIIGIFLPQVFGVGYEAINDAVWNNLELKLLLLLLGAKMIATAFTLGSGGSGGVFAPSIYFGAMLGASTGIIANMLFPQWTASPGAYALVGMGAMLSGVTHMPITAILMIFEFTNNYLIIPPLMIASIISVLLSNQIAKKSIETAVLESKGINIHDKREVNLLRSILVSSVMETDPVLIKRSSPFSEVITSLLSGKSHFAIVVDEKDSYIGSVELNDIREHILDTESVSPTLIASDVANSNIPFVLPEDNLDLIMHIFGQVDKDHIAVCNNAQEKKVIGIVTKSAVINAYNMRIFQEDLTGGFSSLLDSADDSRSIEVLGGMHICEIDVPVSWIEKTIKEIDIRKKYELEILVVHHSGSDSEDKSSRPGEFPSPSLILQPGDKLLVLGNPETIEKIQKA
ncbi:MAG: chloride channel protein, partial [Ignavibacteriaceae bacterium]|nr:chloride channel protein [Ignavibacteriaceae bacterium]